MKHEEKQLILQDLSARLPYGVICLIHNINSDDYNVSITGNDIDLFSHHFITIKPYLRTMSSMTEEEEIYYNTVYTALKFYEKEDWLNANHFDYRGLIPMNLALEAPKGMYN